MFPLLSRYNLNFDMVDKLPDNSNIQMFSSVISFLCIGFSYIAFTFVVLQKYLLLSYLRRIYIELN